MMKFDEKLKETGGLSRWFSTIVLLASLPIICNVLLNTVFMKISSLDFKTRCCIPQLENKNWSFDQVQRISAPFDMKVWNCTYFEYNYTAIAEMDYNEALTYVEIMKDLKISYCTEFVHEGSPVYSVYEEFSLVCRKAGIVEILNIVPMYGQLLASVTLLPLADLFGRKRTIKWGANLFIAGALITSLANSADILILSRFLIGMAYPLMIQPLEAIVVEISNVELQPLYFITMHIPLGLGFITISLIATKIWHWRLLQWAVCSSLLVFPLITWYVPESPGWFMSKAEKTKAWTILKNVKDPVTQHDLLLSYRNEKRKYWEEIKAHVAASKPFLSQLLFLTALCFISNAVYFKNFIVRFQMTFYNKSRANYFMLSGIEEIISYLLCLPLLLFFGRKSIMGFLFICSGVDYFFASQLKTGTTRKLISILTTELMTSAVYITSLLYVHEIVPTSHRCTFTGIVYGFGGGLATIIMFYMYNHFSGEDHLFVFLSCLCFIGVNVVLFADETQPKDMYDTVEEDE